MQKSNPLQIQADNEFLQQVAQVCAQYGEPLPPESVIGLMEGYRTKTSVLRAVQENSRGKAELAALRAQVEELSQALDGEKKLSAGLRQRMASAGGALLARQEKRAQGPDDAAMIGDTGAGAPEGLSSAAAAQATAQAM